MKILTSGENILYAGDDLTDLGDRFAGGEYEFPKNATEDLQAHDIEAPDGFTAAGFRWADGAVHRLPLGAEQFAALVKEYDGHVQKQLDEVARGFNYGDPNRPGISPILHAISYAEEPAVPKFQAEGLLLRAWRSLYWAACWPILEAVRAGQREIPDPGALIAELDAAAPPPTVADVNAKIAELTT